MLRVKKAQEIPGALPPLTPPEQRSALQPVKDEFSKACDQAREAILGLGDDLVQALKPFGINEDQLVDMKRNLAEAADAFVWLEEEHQQGNV